MGSIFHRFVHSITAILHHPLVVFFIGVRDEKAWSNFLHSFSTFLFFSFFLSLFLILHFLPLFCLPLLTHAILSVLSLPWPFLPLPYHSLPFLTIHSLLSYLHKRSIIKIVRHSIWTLTLLILHSLPNNPSLLLRANWITQKNGKKINRTHAPLIYILQWWYNSSLSLISRYIHWIKDGGLKRREKKSHNTLFPWGVRQHKGRGLTWMIYGTVLPHTQIHWRSDRKRRNRIKSREWGKTYNA